MILMRVLLGIAMVFLQRLRSSGLYANEQVRYIPRIGVAHIMLVQARLFVQGEVLSQKRLIEDEEEQQLRFAFVQVGEVLVLATGNIVNFAVSQF